VEEHGGPEVLRILDIPAPEPGPDEVVVDIVSMR
jgi:NADPH:quinone reductase-like Zn-dependent oxidoreductase